MSGEHAAVVTILADSFLEDLGSTNGTLVNGAAVAKHFLRDRDEIDIGQQVLVYLADDAATLEALPPSGRNPGAAGQHGGKDATTPTTAAATPGAARRAARQAPIGSHRAGIRAAPSIASSGHWPPISTVARWSAAAAARDAGGAVAASPPPAPRPEPAPALKVVSGAKAGRIVALVKDETLIGRTGVQVVALRRTADEVRVVPIEGGAAAFRQREPGGSGGTAARGGGHPRDRGDQAGGRGRGEGSFGLMFYWMARQVERMMLARQVSGMVGGGSRREMSGGDRSGADRRRELPPSGTPGWPGTSHSIVVNKLRSPQNHRIFGLSRTLALKHHKKQMLIICP